MEATIVNSGSIGIMEKKMEATIVNWGYNGIMEKKRDTTIMGSIHLSLRFPGRATS